MKNNLEKYGLPVLSGILLSWAFPRFHWFWLAWVALVPLFWAALRADPRRAAFQFFLTGWVFHSILLQWLCANIFWAGGWAIIAQQLLCVLLSLHWAALALIWKGLERRWPIWMNFLWIAPLWWGMEWLMARWFSGFGWSALGYSQGACLPIAQWAAVAGDVSFISFLIVLVNALLALALFEPKRIIRVVLAAALVAVVVGLGYLRLQNPVVTTGAEKLPTLKVGLLQPALAQEIKWDPYFDDFITNMLESHTRAMAKEGPVNLVVWPEAAVPGDLAREATLEPLRALTKDTGACLLTGITRDDINEHRSYNSACLLTPDGKVTGVYDKVHLAPWGEYIPFEKWFPFLRGIAYGGVDAGNELKVFQVGERKVGPLICFEVLFSPLAKELKRKGADFLVVMTNLAWFGQSNVMLQELELARFRAIETGLSLIHSGNTGISGVFDGLGQFSPVSDYLRKDGTLSKYPANRVNPAMVQGRRLVGVFDLSIPLKTFQWEFMLPLVGFGLILAWTERWRKKRSGKAPDKSKP